MKRVVFSIVLLTAAVAAAEQQWEGDLLRDDGGLDGTVGITWDSQYIWRGFDVFDDESAVHILADLNLFDTGFGVSVVAHRAFGREFEDLTRVDGTAYYQNSLFAGEPYVTNYRLGYVYYYYPGLNEGESLDLMEGHVVLSWPNLLPIEGLQPSYVAAYTRPGRLDETWGVFPSDHEDNMTGWIQILMLDYGFTVPALFHSLEDQVIRLHSELVYNDSVSPYGDNISSAFSHAVFGASTDFTFGADKNIVLTPAVYYQLSLEDTVNTENEFWVSVGLKYEF